MVINTIKTKLTFKYQIKVGYQFLIYDDNEICLSTTINVLKIDSGMLYYTVDVEGGQSGSPIMYYNNERNQFYICGIHTARKYGQITTNSGTYLTNIIY